MIIGMAVGSKCIGTSYNGLIQRSTFRRKPLLWVIIKVIYKKWRWDLSLGWPLKNPIDIGELFKRKRLNDTTDPEKKFHEKQAEDLSAN